MMRDHNKISTVPSYESTKVLPKYFRTKVRVHVETTTTTYNVVMAIFSFVHVQYTYTYCTSGSTTLYTYFRTSQTTTILRSTEVRKYQGSTCTCRSYVHVYESTFEGKFITQRCTVQYVYSCSRTSVNNFKLNTKVQLLSYNFQQAIQLPSYESTFESS